MSAEYSSAHHPVTLDVKIEITVYGCERDEELVFRAKAPSLGVLPILTAAPLSDDTIELAIGSRCISVGHKSPITNAHLSALSRIGVRYISTRSVGFDHIDVTHAERVGIRVENVAYSPGSVADYTLMLMLMAARHAGPIFRRADVDDYRLNDVRGRELGDLTVGVVGTGRIGSAVVERLRGFGCRILASDDRRTTAAEYVTLDELVRRSDIITLHTPLSSATRHLLDAARIGAMKADAVVVNTARGALIDTDALIEALRSRRLGGAALDVLEEEEGLFYTDRRDGAVPSEHLLRLRALPNVIISPHTAFHTDHALSDTVENSLANCLRFEGALRG